MTIFNLLAQQLVNGLVLGSFYALVALGYTMVFGVVKLLNFAHGDLYMVGAFVGFLALSGVSGMVGAGWAGVGLSILCAMVAVGVLGVAIERIAYQPMLKAPRLSILITALAVSLVLQNSLLTMTNGQIVAFSPKLGFAGINLDGVFINFKQIVLAGPAAVPNNPLELFLPRPQCGREMPARLGPHDPAAPVGVALDHRLVRVGRGELRQRDAADRGGGDDRHHLVAVAAEHHRGDVLRRGAGLPCDEGAEARGVEDAGHAEHALAGPAGNVLRHVAHGVERVRDHHEGRIR